MAYSADGSASAVADTNNNCMHLINVAAGTIGLAR